MQNCCRSVASRCSSSAAAAAAGAVVVYDDEALPKFLPTLSSVVAENTPEIPVILLKYC